MQIGSNCPTLGTGYNCDFSQVKILDAMQDIYYGRVASPWALDVDDWSIDPNQVRFII